MAIITIKTSQSTNTPSSLANGELAYSYSSDKLFIGQTDTAGDAITVEYIGGKLLVDKVANLESQLAGGGNIQVQTVNVLDKIQFTSGKFVQNGVLFAKSGGIVDFVYDATAGKLLQIAANGTPTFDDLNGGSF